MSVSSTSIRDVPAQRPITFDQGLRRLRRLCFALTVVCAVLLPFETGIVPQPDLSMINLSGLPYIGKFFPQPQPSVLYNSLRTVIVGQTEHFSARLPDRLLALVTYVLVYPNGHTIRAVVRTDARGNSGHTFLITYRPHHYREVVVIEVFDSSNKLRAFTRFAVQLPS